VASRPATSLALAAGIRFQLRPIEAAWAPIDWLALWTASASDSPRQLTTSTVSPRARKIELPSTRPMAAFFSSKS
jgi:hypothetical protein